MPGMGPWRHHHKKGPHRSPRWPRRRHFLFLRFLFAMGSMAFLIAGALALGALLFVGPTGEGQDSAAFPFWLGGCTLAILLPLTAAIVGRRFFRRTISPMADLMTAVQAVGEGDLTVRVRESGSEFGRLGQAFNEMVAELARSEQQRRNLTADVAHELRTPLHIIQGNLEGILDGVYEADPAHIEATLEETQALARLVDDLQTLSLAEADQLPLVWEDVEVAELLTDVATSFSGQAEAAGLTLTCRTDDVTGVIIQADNGRLNQVLSSLVMNALRHTPAGGRIELAGNSENSLTLTVSDSGQGIPAADLPFIFDRFWRGDRARQHGPGVGAGLGLAIARQLVRAHGGQIEVASREGEGTQFTIHLPLRQTPPLK